MSHARFWMVYAEGGSAPCKKHRTLVSAEAEAQRIAKKNAGSPVYVLAAIEGYAIPDPEPVRFVTVAQPEVSLGSIDPGEVRVFWA